MAVAVALAATARITLIRPRRPTAASRCPLMLKNQQRRTRPCI